MYKRQVNGQPVSLPALSSLRSTRSESSKEETIYEVPLPLPGLDVQLLLFAENKHGVSPEASLAVKRPPAAAAKEAPAGVDLRPALYVLTIGISKYQDASIQQMCIRDRW